MGTDGWITLAILVAAVVLFLTEWLPLEVTALAIPVVLAVTGVVSDPADVLVGFGSHAVIALAAVFVISAGLQESGVAAMLGRWMEDVGRGSETRQLIVMAVPVAMLSAFMPNAAAVAVLLPAVLALARRSGIARSKLLMPLAFSAILGGSLTLIGTVPNLILSDRLRDYQGEGFGMFDFAVVGGPIVIAGIAYMAFVGRRLLPERHTADRLRAARLPEELARQYGLIQDLTRMRVGRQCALVGRTVGASDIGSNYRLRLVLVERQAGLGARSFFPGPDLRFQEGDDLYVDGEQEDIWIFAEEERLRIGLPGGHHVEHVLEHGVALGEFAVAPRAEEIGSTVRQLDFRARFGLNVLALWRGEAPTREGLADIPLQAGDALLVAGPARRQLDLVRDTDFVALTQPPEVRDARLAPIALLLLALAVVPVVFGLAPLALSALAAAVLMSVTGCVSPRGIRRAIDWRVLFLVIGTMPLGAAVESTGIADRAADAVLALTAGSGHLAIFALLFLLAAVFSNTVNNAAAAVILAPIAARTAASAGLEVKEALLAVAFGCSCAFLIPFSNQCNLMVLGPGGYRTRDFLLMGGGLTLVSATVAVAGLTLL